jgi:hypothetical protein
VAVGALAALLVLAFVLLRGGDDYPEPGDARLHDYVERIAKTWRGRQAKDGRYVDPVNGIPANGYGTALIGYAQLTSPDEDAQRQGFRALGFALSEREAERGVFDQLVIARGYNWAREHLSHSDGFDDLRGKWRSNLERTADISFFRPGAWVECFKSDDCYSNHEMVEAMADFELLRTGVDGKGAHAKVRARDALRARSLRLIGELAGRAAGRAAYSAEHRGLGVLSDTGPYPLGYHVLSTALLAMAVDELGDDAPDDAREVLRRSLRTLDGFMAPDGDMAYMGARYEQAWILAAAVYAGRAGGRILGDPRGEGIARRALARLQRAHPLEATGLRVGTRPLGGTYRGIDGAQIPANGLALFFLREASRLEPGEAAAPGVDRPGWSFVDPDHTRIAVRRTPDLWFAVRAQPRLPVDPKRDPDQRFDFGVIGLKQRAGGGWRDLIEPRPRTTVLGIHSSGPVLLAGGEIGYPWGERIEVRGGGVDVVGGFRARNTAHAGLPGRWLRRDVTFRYRRRGRGLELTWDAQAGDRYHLLLWGRGGRHTRTPTGVRVGAANHVFSAPPAAWTVSRPFTSCCALDVRPVQGDIVAPGGPLTWLIEPVNGGQ